MLTNVVFRCAIFITSKSSDTPLQPQWAIGKNFSSVQAIGNPVAKLFFMEDICLIIMGVNGRKRENTF